MVEVTKKTTGDGDDAPVARRTNPVVFFQQVVKELKKVTWPSWKETWLTSVMVLIMVVLTMIFFFFVDSLLNRGQMLLIGAWRPFG